jgi:hypothetical protein
MNKARLISLLMLLCLLAFYFQAWGGYSWFDGT